MRRIPKTPQHLAVIITLVKRHTGLYNVCLGNGIKRRLVQAAGKADAASFHLVSFELRVEADAVVREGAVEDAVCCGVGSACAESFDGGCGVPDGGVLDGVEGLVCLLIPVASNR